MNPTHLSFPLYRRPGGVVFLDDDGDYLEMLAEVMPPDWYVRMFLRPVACIDQLDKETLQWEADAWAQQEIINRWHAGAMLIPQILQYWRDDGMARFALTRVCVVDYAMPAMSGLRVLGELTGWSGSRILLTGRADEQLAVSAFNRGLIDQFIAKQSPGIRLRLTEAIQTLRQVPDTRHQQTWRATLSREQHALLCEPAIFAALEKVALQQGWIEQVAIGAPFGLLALNAQGSVSWLQLERSENLTELAERAESQGLDAATVQDIGAGRQLVDLELQLALGVGENARAQPAFAVGGAPARLYAAVFSVPDYVSPGPAASYARFSATVENRVLED
jgi:CheY-like chemotaxis protein